MVQVVKNKNTFNDIIYVGDIHGNFDVIGYNLKRFQMRNTAIIQVGDFGIGFSKSEDEKLKKLNTSLKLRDCVLFAIRGNHDDPALFNNNFAYSNIFFINDWTILELDLGHKVERIFCFGGALSIDRIPGRENGTWFENEKPKFDDSLIDQVKNISIIVTHTSPDRVEPYTMAPIVYRFAQNDPTLLDECFKERREMTYMMDRIIDNNKDTLHSYFYGHFHFSSFQLYRGIKFRLLGIDEICSGT